MFKRIVDKANPFRSVSASVTRVILVAVTLQLVSAHWNSVSPSTSLMAAAGDDQSSGEYLNQLIERLGSTEFAQRERASDELMQLGIEAFDVLNQARSHEDVEVRKQAEYLMRTIRVVWVKEGDDPLVKELLRNYRGSPLDERESRLKRLVRVEGGAGIEPLCRLVRFETSENLSKRAALLVMNAELPERGPEDEPWDQLIERVIRSSERPAADWMRLYANYLRDPGDALDDFEPFVAAEERDANERPDKTRLVILRDLLRWQVDSLEQLGRREDAIAMMWRTLDVQDATSAELIETVDWLIERSAWPLIDVLAEKFSVAFQSNPSLLYRQAEASLRVGDEVRAAELAAEALGISNAEEPFSHVDVAQELQTRGLFDWAEREYRLVINEAKPISPAGFDARIRLGWMLHDLSRNKDAYETLNGLVDLVSQDKAARRVLGEMDRDLNRIRGQMHFSKSLYLSSQGEWEAEAGELKKAIKYDRFNADIMIAMFRVPEASEDFVKQTRKTIQTTADRYRSAVLIAERTYQTVRNQDSLERYALMLNQYAWLVSNTEGDFKSALESSKKSLELIPDDPGYLDTLARCYYAVGDLEQAVATQEEAVRFDPHSGQIKRQLEFFEKALSERNAEQAKAP